MMLSLKNESSTEEMVAPLTHNIYFKNTKFTKNLFLFDKFL